MLKRAEKMMAGLEGERAADKVARIKFPAPAPCGKTPLTATELPKRSPPEALLAVKWACWLQAVPLRTKTYAAPDSAFS
jgi:hypothetical protein